MKTITATLITSTSAPVWKREYAGTTETLVYAGPHIEDAERMASVAASVKRNDDADCFDSDIEITYRVRIDFWQDGLIVSMNERDA